MRVVNELPLRVREVELAWIPLSDGCRLAARLWLPESPEVLPVPAILEYIPYRRRDVTRARDDVNHRYFAGHGYACVRVDLRGSGDSEGLLTDEYLSQELDDGIEVIRWIAAQPWCTGQVGMIGISWGGFNGLQIAALRPPELKAVITVCATDDRYADDVHYMGGCLLTDNLSWASRMFLKNASPPDPEMVGDRWREMWLERLEGSGLWLETWLRHQRRDSYWRHGSVCEDLAAIACPVYAISGWADGYSNAVFRLLEGLEVPRKGLVGPWAHRYPHVGVPGPAIGFLQEALRWWDHWLKDVETGIMDEPMVQVWMQESVAPAAFHAERPGRWVAEPRWPAPSIRALRYRLAPDRRLLPSAAPAAEVAMTVRSPLAAGLEAGAWCSYGRAPDVPGDQRADDGGALVFESEPLAERLEILGAPVVNLDIAGDRPVAMLVARLSDVAPDGQVARVTYGLLNLTHRESHERPEPLVPGRRCRVVVQLNDIAHAFPAGHRLRLALASCYWPLVWPSPEAATLTVFTGGEVALPARPATAETPEPAVFRAPEGAPPSEQQVYAPPRYDWRVVRDRASETTTLEIIQNGGRCRLPALDLEIAEETREAYSSQGNDFGSARCEIRGQKSFARGEWRTETRTSTVVTSSRECFRVRAALRAFERDKEVFSREWDLAIPRDLV